MTSSGVNSAASVRIQSSESEKDAHALMDQRKRKRMQSNRESARRSRQRKQKHLDDLVTQVSQLKAEKGRLVTGISATALQLRGMENDNSVLSARVGELKQQLESLNQIVGNISAAGGGDHYCNGGGGGVIGFADGFPAEGLMEPWMNWGGSNPPIMDAFSVLN